MNQAILEQMLPCTGNMISTKTGDICRTETEKWNLDLKWNKDKTFTQCVFDLLTTWRSH